MTENQAENERADAVGTFPETRPRAAGASVGERGQATAEYALVMLAAAALAGLLLAWAAGTGGIGRLLDAVMDSLVSQTE